MEKGKSRIVGALVFSGATFFMASLLVASAIYPNYSVHSNAISDLGIGPTAWLFDAAIILLNFTLFATAYLFSRASVSKALTSCLFLTASGSIGIMVFNETYGMLHLGLAVVAFVSSGMSAILSYKIVTGPYRILSAVLGVTSLTALVLFAAHLDLGLGTGGIEELIVYPTLIWAIGLGGYMMGRSEAGSAHAPQPAAIEK